MSLFGAISKSMSGLNVAQLGMQVVGNNVSNANTPGYIRQRLVQTPGPPVRNGSLILGTGVIPVGIVQVIDNALAERMRNATSDLASSNGIGDSQGKLESLLNELGDNDLSSQLSAFNNSLHDLANQPDDFALKQLVMLRGQTMANQINQMGDRAKSFASGANAGFSADLERVNALTQKVATLNQKIVDIEGGRSLGSDATGLRDERESALNELAGYMRIKTKEQEYGSVSVFVGGDYLVNDGFSRDVYAASTSNDPNGEVQIRIKSTNAPLDITGGKLAGSLDARDGIYGKFISQLDSVAKNIASVFNRIYTQGKGTTGYTDLTSVVGIDPSVPLEQAKLDFVPENGSFNIEIYGDDDELQSTHRIDVDLLGKDGGTRLQDIVAQINAIEDLQASVDNEGKLNISTSISGLQFGFGEDSSGFLAAIGLNTFFVGTDSFTLGINENLQNNPNLFALSKGGIDTDVENLVQLVDSLEKPVDELNGASVRDHYQQLVTSISQNAAIQGKVIDGLETYQAALESQYQAVSSVNIDEEAIRMIYLQRSFQASSRVIATASEMLELLTNL